jgi:hypothetical protein
MSFITTLPFDVQLEISRFKHEEKFRVVLDDLKEHVDPYNSQMYYFPNTLVLCGSRTTSHGYKWENHRLWGSDTTKVIKSVKKIKERVRTEVLNKAFCHLSKCWVSLDYVEKVCKDVDQEKIKEIKTQLDAMSNYLSSFVENE